MLKNSNLNDFWTDGGMCSKLKEIATQAGTSLELVKKLALQIPRLTQATLNGIRNCC